MNRWSHNYWNKLKIMRRILLRRPKFWRSENMAKFRENRRISYVIKMSCKVYRVYWEWTELFKFIFTWPPQFHFKNQAERHDSQITTVTDSAIAVVFVKMTLLRCNLKFTLVILWKLLWVIKRNSEVFRPSPSVRLNLILILGLADI